MSGSVQERNTALSTPLFVCAVIFVTMTPMAFRSAQLHALLIAWAPAMAGVALIAAIASATFAVGVAIATWRRVRRKHA